MADRQTIRIRNLLRSQATTLKNVFDDRYDNCAHSSNNAANYLADAAKLAFIGLAETLEETSFINGDNVKYEAAITALRAAINDANSSWKTAIEVVDGFSWKPP